MEEQEVVKKFLDKGLLLTPEAAASLKTKREEEIYNLLNKTWAQSILSQTEIDAILSKPKVEYKILMNLTSKPEKMTQELEMRYFASRYETMKQIYSERLAKEWVSLGRLPHRGEVWLLGVVRDINKGQKIAVEIEDPTGSRRVLFDEAPGINLDEMIAVRCNVVGKYVYGKEVVWPDVPLRSPTKGKGRGIFISDLHLNEAPSSELRKFFDWLVRQDIDWLFITGDIGDLDLFEEMAPIDIPIFLIPGEGDSHDTYPKLPLKFTKKNIVTLSNPAMIEVGGLKVLLIHKFNNQMVRKRRLGESQTVLEEDFLTLTNIPDIIAYGHDHKPFVSNYKSTTLLNGGSLLSDFKPVVIDFATRDIQQVNLDVS